MNKHPEFDVFKYAAEVDRLARIESTVLREAEMKKAKDALGFDIPLASFRKDIDVDRKKMASETARAKSAPAIAGSVEKFNEEYAVVDIAGQVCVLRETTDENGRWLYELQQKAAFLLWTADLPKVDATNEYGDEVKKPSAVIWLEHGERRKYDGIVFAPGESVLPAPGQRWPRFYNSWRGWGVDACEQGSCKLVKAYFLKIVCNDDEARFRWLWYFLAHMFQKPKEKPSVSLGFIGPKGCGKTIFGEIIGVLVGDRHYVPLSQELFEGRFNGHMRSALFVQSDEAIFTKDPRVAKKLNREITAKTRMIEDKGVRAVPCRACERYLHTGEDEDAIPAETGERRHAVFRLSDAHQKDVAYFKAIKAELENGGYERLLYELLNTDISGFDCHTAIETEALAAAKLNNLVNKPEAQFLVDIAMTLELWDTDEKGRQYMTVIPKAQLRDLYFEKTKRRRTYDRATETALGMLWNSFGFKSERMTLKTSRKINEEWVEEGTRVQAYLLPDPQKLREQLIKEYELPADCFKDGAEAVENKPSVAYEDEQ